MRVFLTNIDDWKAAIDVRKEYFRDVRPADTIMAVDRFVNSEWLVELTQCGQNCQTALSQAS